MTALSEHLRSLGLSPETLLPRYQAFYTGLLAANQTMNLTRITDADEFWLKHIWDTLTLIPHLQPETRRVLDLGTGGGIPGVPLWLTRPELEVSLLDSVGKKLRAVHGICEQVATQEPALTHLPQTLHMRAEDAGRDKAHRETYDLVISRAVASLPVLVELCLPLVRRGGLFIAMKGPQYHSEMEDIEPVVGLLGGRLAAVAEPTLPGDQQRVLLVFEKRSHTPRTLPREAGVPQKKPLTTFVAGT
ncbi:MAG: 16S rRNA (guanine(527)-N(7))-methyltransferase RsmG [Candidatus Sericytochromatia bacterium]